MVQRRNYTGILMFFMISILTFVLAYIFWVTWNDYYRRLVVDPFYQKGSLLLTVVYIIIYFLFSKIYDSFKIGRLKTSEIIYSQALSLFFTNVIIYMQISLLVKKIVNPNILIFVTIIEIIIVTIWAYICNKIYFYFIPPLNIILVYGNDSATSLISKVNGHKDKYNISSAINVDEGLDTILKEIDKYEAVVICDLDSSIRNKIVKYCFKKSIRIYLTPKISDIIIRSSDNLHIFDTPILICKNQGLNFMQKILKRTMDITISILAIILTLPFMVITAISIKLYDKGPIIFKQKRLTLDNKVFEIYKFRSMIVNAEKSGEARLASQDDDRITLVGRIIRKIRFDELPQLFNILIGDMSIVGPRPERPEIVAQYIKVMPEFNFRTKVKAGLTGYAQVMGKYNTTPYDKLKLDLMYIGNYSMFMDIKLILMTFKILFKSESTEGVENEEIFPELAYSSDEEKKEQIKSIV